jgi:hypothetical protein
MNTNTTTTRGLKNNNPGNIRKSNQIFRGEIQQSTDTQFKQFVNIEYGYRAIFVLLQTYILVHELNTITKIIQRYAPSNENNTQQYINTVSKQTNIKPDEIIHVYDKDKLIKIVEAISYVENGTKPNINEIKRAYKLYKLNNL